MKKIVLILAAILMITTTHAQEINTVSGFTKEGKRINVQYKKGTTKDIIESVKYELVDELKADNQSKQRSINNLQDQLNNANKTINSLKEQLKSAGQNDNYKEQLSQKQSEIEQLNEQIRQLNELLEEKQTENNQLKQELDSIKQINLLLSQNKKRKAKSSIFGMEAGMGAVTLLGNDLHDPWGKALSWNKQVSVYYGSSSLTDALPLSIEAGVGFRSLPLSAVIKNYETQEGISQYDNDNYPFYADYVFNDFTEKLTLNCVEVPIRFSLEYPLKNEVSLYTKLGITPAFILSSKLANSPYTRKGYYQQWNVYLEDIEELDFFTNQGESSESMTPDKKFILNGNLALGAYLPLSRSILFNVGAKFDYPLMKTGTFKSNQASTNARQSQLLPDGIHYALCNSYGNPLTSSVQLGLIYKIRQ